MLVNRLSGVKPRGETGATTFKCDAPGARTEIVAKPPFYVAWSLFLNKYGYQPAKIKHFSSLLVSMEEFHIGVLTFLPLKSMGSKSADLVGKKTNASRQALLLPPAI